ncbi:acyl-CoA desaturase [Roseomonas sp. CCTCC AB2023176]|uniref:acyl-CoA desaturase n=1 Tax=Roseomonas sp. CCTCC AB2023176 TaxID=3342640 RepID=UPI0035DA9830
MSVAQIPIHFAHPAATPFLKEVRREVAAVLAARGDSRLADGRLWLKGVVLCAVAIAAYAALLAGVLPAWACLAAAAVWGIATLLLAINIGHDAAHDVLSRQRWVNRLAQHLTFALVGCDASLWRLRHVRSHHVFPNAAGCDIDIDENPVLRLSPHHPLRPWQRWQHLYAPLAYALVGLHTTFFGDVAYLRKRELADLRDIRHPPGRIAAFVLGKAIFLAVTLVIPLTVVDQPWWQVVLGALVSSAAASLAFVMLLIGTHFAEEAEFPVLGQDGALPGDWAAHAVRTSVDWSPGSRIAAFLSGGANCHVAHHLFPNLSHIHYRTVTPVIAAVAARHGLPYRAMRPWDLVRSHFRLLRRLGREEAG